MYGELDSFWGMRAGKLPRVPILKLEDMVRLYAAREWLQRQWRVLVLTPPGRVVDVEGRATGCMCISQKEGREKGIQTETQATPLYSAE